MLKCYSYDIVCQEIPDEITLAVNISCCPNRCPGCHSPWLWEDRGELMTEEMLSALIGNYSASWIKSKYPNIRTAWYSGRAELPDSFDARVLDYLKLGPYIEALGGLKSPDTNQVLYRIEKDGSFVRMKL